MSATPEAPVPDQQDKGASAFRPDVQGLRAVAVLAVVLYHAGVSVLPGGYAGVDVFFVISGFLITGHLLSMLREHGTIRFGQFYARRARRILPAALTVLILSAGASLLFVPRVDVPGTMNDAAATALYAPNILFAIEGTDYLAENSPSPFQHYWSLGIEEQFYLLWPLILLGAFLPVRRIGKRFGIALAGVVAASFACNLLLLESYPAWAFFSLPARAWELGVGALAAYALGCMTHGRLRAPVSRVLLWTGVAGILASFVLLDSSTAFPGWAALLPVLSTAAVVIGGSGGRQPRALTNRMMQALGRWSYSIYLVHWPLLTIPQLAVGVENRLPLPLTLALGALSVPLAILLHRFIEQPFRHQRGFALSVLKQPASPLRRVSATTVMTVGSLVVACSAYGVGLHIDRIPITSSVAAQREAGTPYPSGTAFVPSNVTPQLEDAATSAPPTNGDGCHAAAEQTTLQTQCIYGDTRGTEDVVLFGDSHAEQWFAGVDLFARDTSSRLHTFTKSSCPAVSIAIKQTGTPYTACDQWRANALKEIRKLKPRLVILSSYGLVNPTDSSAGLADQWEAGLTATIKAMPRETRVVVLADTPAHSASPASCLSRNVEQASACDAERAQAIDPVRAASERRVATENGARFVDMNKYLCADDCPVIIGDILAYRDSHHLSAPMVEALAPSLVEELMRAV